MSYLYKDIKLTIFLTMTPKNHTISRIVAKTCVRLLMVLLVLSIYLSFGNNDQNIQQLLFQSYWAIITPFLLFGFVIVLLILALKNKYHKTDLNWLFSLSALFFSIYLVLLYSRIYSYL